MILQRCGKRFNKYNECYHHKADHDNAVREGAQLKEEEDAMGLTATTFSIRPAACQQGQRYRKRFNSYIECHHKDDCETTESITLNNDLGRYRGVNCHDSFQVDAHNDTNNDPANTSTVTTNDITTSTITTSFRCRELNSRTQ